MIACINLKGLSLFLLKERTFGVTLLNEMKSTFSKHGLTAVVTYITVQAF